MGGALNQTLCNFIIATLMPEDSRTTGMARPTTAAGLRLGAHGHGGACGLGRTPAWGRLHRLVGDELSDAAVLD